MSEPQADEGGTAAERTESRHRLIEILSATLLGVAGLLTAYAAYQASLTDGEALAGYTQSQRTTADANGLFSEAVAIYTNDQNLFLDYALELERGNPDTADSIRTSLFSPQLEAATAAWDETGDDGPLTPLGMPEYVIDQQLAAEALQQQAAEEFAAAEQADAAGDTYSLATVFLAVSLFLGGVASLFKNWVVRVVVLSVAAAFLVPGIMAILNARAAA